MSGGITRVRWSENGRRLLVGTETGENMVLE
mgnify:FL=1